MHACDNGLQKVKIVLNSFPMYFRKSSLIIFCAAFFASAGIKIAAAAEEADIAPSGPISILERYTTGPQDLVLTGLEKVGMDYRRGGTDPDNGFDCSGFVQHVFKESIGKFLPRTAKEQSEVGEPVPSSNLKVGDLVFFNTMRRAFSHVGIYLGDGHFMHSPRSGAQIRVEKMTSTYWRKRYNGARRIL